MCIPIQDIIITYSEIIGKHYYVIINKILLNVIPISIEDIFVLFLYNIAYISYPNVVVVFLFVTRP